MAVSQSVTSSRFPYLPIRPCIYVRGAADLDFDIEALLDTGFDGGVAVPADLLAGYPPAGYLPWSLADESEVLTPAYRGEVTTGILPLHAWWSSH